MFTLAQELYFGCQTENINGIIPNLNKGGCGIFAEHFYKALKQFGLKPKLGIITYKGNEGTLKLAIATNENHGIMYVRHVVVIIDKKLYDSTGIYKTVNDTTYMDAILVRNLSLELLEQWNKDRSYWNNRFDTKQIKTVENIIQKSFKKLEKDLQVLY